MTDFQQEVEKVVGDFVNVKNSCSVVRHAGASVVSLMTPVNRFIFTLRQDVLKTDGELKLVDLIDFVELSGQIELARFTDVYSEDSLRKFIAIVQLRISSFLVSRETLALLVDIRDNLKPLTKQAELVAETNVYLRKINDAFERFTLTPRV